MAGFCPLDKLHTSVPYPFLVLFHSGIRDPGQGTTGLCPEEEVLFHLRARYQAERVQLATNDAAGGSGRGVASIDKGLRPEALCEIPDVGVRASRATRQVNLADQEAALQFHQRAFGRKLFRWFTQPRAAPEFTPRLGGMIEQPCVDRLCFTGKPTIEIEPIHVPLVLQAASGQSSDEIGKKVGSKEAGLASNDLAIVELLSKMQVIFPKPGSL